MTTLDDAIDRFDLLWRQGQDPSVQAYLRQITCPETAQAELLAELASIEMEYRWRRAVDDPAVVKTRSLTGPEAMLDETSEQVCLDACPLVDAYLTEWPELAAQDELQRQLIAEEYRVRHRWGDRPALDEYTRRFGSDASLLHTLQEVRRELELDSRTVTAVECDSQATAEIRSGPGSASPHGSIFGRYQLLRRLGRGGMGEVFLAQDLQLERKVALKIPRVERDVPQFRERFINEAKAAAMLRHPGLCPVYDSGVVDDQPYLTMAYIEGESLANRWKRNELTTPLEWLPILVQIAKAMQAAHDAGIVHRDLKPSNVMIEPDGNAVVMDFGLACRRTGEGTERITRPGDAFGSPAYMSPEQVEGKLADIGAPSDIYSLGVMLFEILAKRLPFIGNTSAIMVQIARDAPPRPGELYDGVDPELEALCLQMLSKTPSERPASMNEVAERLTVIHQQLAEAAALGGLRIRTDPDSHSTSGHRPATTVAAKRVRYAGMRLAALCLLGGVTLLGALGVILHLQGEKGSVVIEASPEIQQSVSVTVLRDGSPSVEGWEIAPGTRNTRVIRTGRVEVTLPGDARDRLTIERMSEHATLSRNGRLLFRISRVPDEAPAAPLADTWLSRIPDWVDPEAHRQVAEWVIRRGGQPYLIGLTGEQLGGPNDVRKLPLAPFRVVHVSFFNQDVTPVELEQLGPARGLSSLRIEQTDLSPAHLQRIASLEGLKRIWLQCNVTANDVDDDDIAALLAAQPNLESLTLANFPVDGSFLRSLPERPRLNDLRLTQGRWTGPLAPRLRDDLADLLQSIMMRFWLNLSGQQKLSPELLAGLSKVETLVRLDASYSRGLSDQLSALANLPDLRELHIGNAGLDDDDARALQAFTRLRILDVSGNAISDAAVAELRAALPDCEVKFGMSSGDTAAPADQDSE